MKKMFFMLVSLFIVTGIAVVAQDQTRKQDRIHQEDHLILRDGSCYLVKQGVQTKLQTQLKLNNGTVVNPDGSYQLQNQQRYQLRDGECMDMNSNRYLNQNKFNKRVMMTNKQIERMGTNAMNKNRPGNQGGGRRGGAPNSN
jgi:hypothetical protein